MNQHFSIEGFLFSILLLFSFFSFIILLGRLKDEKREKFVLGISFASICLLCIFSFVQEEGLFRMIRINSSILGILISAHTVFLFFLYITKSKVKWLASKIFANIIPLIILFASFALVSTNSRSGIIGLVFTLALFPFFLKKKLPNVKAYWITISVVLGILLWLLFYYKKDSTNGRLLVYKVTSKVFNDNFLSGIGLGHFSVTYNKYQADYFASNSIDSKEALLADNTFYAFNDYLQFICETGLIGLVGLICLGYFTYLKLKSKTLSSMQKAAMGFVFCILLGSIFSYPLQIKIVQVLIVFYLAILFINEKEATQRALKSKKIGEALIISITLCLGVIYISLKINYQLEFDKADKLSQLGYKNESLKLYRTLNEHLFCDGYTRFLYARELYNSNKLDEAKAIIKKAKISYIDNEVFALSANILIEQKLYKDAEPELKEALFMVPNRIKSRYELFRFYLNQQDTINAKIWQNSILNMVIKIPSAITDNFIQRTKAIKL